ncbi:CUB domain-containing protein [Adhaeribacter soli]|uniref:T9SS type A sorting domain-containing protein n=1 Tax=Adhaeribacter soli TaxID=2607655 RepID=A0A5N1IIP5_9BACT|nr:CUB domain-containing protein [Adhaeribacter soli]KAA9325016.1 T9SS type A sorting domain-containing protein [Adhaeribacter soli]
MKKLYLSFMAMVSFLALIAIVPAHAQTFIMGSSPVTTCSGTFLDPGGTGDYPLDQQYLQTFTPSTTGSKLRVTFTSFTLETGYDLLAIYDGPTTTSPLINIFTGTVSPGTITATNATGQLTFLFLSDELVSAPGWSATFSCVATPPAGTFSMTTAGLNTCNATWYDQAGSSADLIYGNNADVVQTITPATAGQKVRVSFSSFSLENGGDFLYAYDGPSTSSPLIGTYTGTSIPAAITAANASGVLTFRFTSNASVGAPGWVANIGCVTGTTATVMSASPVTTCSGTYLDPGGIGNYSDNLNLTQTLSPSTSGSKLQLNFTSFDLETGYDYLAIYDGPNTSSPLINFYTGTVSPGTVTATNATGQLTLVLITDGSGTAPGWSANVACVTSAPAGMFCMTNAPISTCNATWYDPAGSSTSFNYGDNLDLTQTITPATAGQKVRVTFSSFNLESGFDFLYVYDGPNTSSPLIGTYTGTTMPAAVTATNASGVLTFRFTSDASTGAQGWVANISCVTGTTATVMSATPVTTCSGTFLDPGSTGNYLNNQAITQTFTPSTPGSKLQFNFTSFELENGVDFLAVYDGPNTSSPFINFYTGTVSPGTITATNSTGQLTFEFYSSASGTAPGWSANIACVTSVPAGMFSMTNAPITTCNASWYDPAGSSSSFNYGYNLNFTQTITPLTTGQKARVTFSAFNLENGGDFLYAYDGPNISSPLIGTYTGTTIPAAITATNASGVLTFRFTSNASVSAPGWAATISCVAPALPTIISFTPNSGSAGTSVTLTGTNFTGATSVTVGGIPVTFTVVNGTTIVLTIPIGAVTGPIVVTTPAGTATSNSNFTVTNPCVTPTASISTSCTSAASQTISIALTGQQPWTVNYTVNGAPQTANNITSSPFVLTVTPASATTYVLTEVSSGTCTGTASGSVTVAPKVTAVATGAAGCPNSAITLTASGAPAGGAYQWYSTASGATAIAGATTASFTTPALTATTTYYVAVVNEYGCEGPRTAAIATINPIPTVVAGSNQTVCANAAPVTLTGYSPAGGTWSGSGVSAGGIFTPSAGLVGTVTLTYTVTQNGCTGTATKTITVSAAPAASAGTDQSLCANDAALQLTGFTPGGGTWAGVGVNPQGLFDPSVSGTGIFPLTYTVTVNGCTSTSSLNMTVKPAPATPTVIPVPTDSLRSSVAGASYEWRRNTFLLPATTRTIKATGSGTYTVKVTDATGCPSAVSADFQFTVSGMGEMANAAANLTLFPNPTSGLVNLKINAAASKISLQVLNTLGQEVLSRQLQTNGKETELSLDLSSVAKGVYLIRVNAGEQVYIRKLIVE